MRKLGLHAGLYLGLLVAVMAVIPLDSSFSSDDGAYGGQVYALRQGDWALARPLLVVEEENEGWLNSAITSGGPTPYTANPAYPLLLRAVSGVVHGGSDGPEKAGSLALGLHVVPVAGALLAALSAWLLAAHWNRNAAPLAFWLVALGPTLVQATTLWAHSLSTGLGGLALLRILSAMDAARQGGVSTRTMIALNYLGAAVLLAGCAVIRTEALFWIIALSAIGAAAAWFHQSLPLALAATGSGGATALVWLASRSWGQSLRADRLPIETSVETLSEVPSWLASRFPAAWQLLLSSLSGGPGPILTLLALGLGGIGALRLRRDESDSSRRLGSALLTIAAGLYAARVIAAPGESISGLLGAWPLVGLLPLAEPARERGEQGSVHQRSLGPLVAPCALLAIAITITQYASSGGLQWGGRYLSLAYAPLAAAAAVRGYRTFREVRPLIALLVLPALAGIVVSYQLHDIHRQVIDHTAQPAAEVVITEYPAVPRLAWPELPVAYYRADDSNIGSLLSALANRNVGTVNVHGLSTVEVDGLGGYRQAGSNGSLRHLVLDPAALGSTPSPGVLALDP